MSETRILKWTKKGYQPERYYWKNYVQSTNVRGLRHDFYHHQLDETGSEQEELRALGGRYRFDKDEGLVRDMLRVHYSRLEILGKVSRLPEGFIRPKFARICTASGVDNPLYYAKFLTEGYLYARQYNKRAYTRFLSHDFEYYHLQKWNVEVDLETGELVRTW